jgi:hypothetical protein
MDNQSVILDLHRSVEKAQGLIYQRMLSSRRRQQHQQEKKILNSYCSCVEHIKAKTKLEIVYLFSKYETRS